MDMKDYPDIRTVDVTVWADSVMEADLSALLPKFGTPQFANSQFFLTQRNYTVIEEGIFKVTCVYRKAEVL